MRAETPHAHARVSKAVKFGLSDGLAVAVLAPGYDGNSAQPILLALERALEARGIRVHPISYSRSRPGGNYAAEVADVRCARVDLLNDGALRVALVGRSIDRAVRPAGRRTPVRTPTGRRR